MKANRINVLPATRESGEILHIEGTQELEPFDFSDLCFTPESELSYRFDVVPATGGVALVGEVAARLKCSCVRCLEDAHIEVSTPFDEEFYFEETFDEEGEAFPRIDDEGYIEISEELFAALLIGIPFAPICSDDCAGLCASCGANLNEDACGCADKPDASHPFANLASLIEKNEDE